MKKLVLLISLSILVFSCQKEDIRRDNETPKMTKRSSSPIKGNWTHVATKDGYNDPWTFESNPETFVITEMEFVGYGTYTYTGSDIILTYPNGDVQVIGYQVNGNSMTWFYPFGVKWKMSKT